MLCIAHFCALPFLALLSLKDKYKHSLKRRFFFFNPIPKDFYFHWLHACSFGEVKSLQSLIEALEKTLKEKERILLTTTTQTGYNLATKLYPHCIVRYLPFETLLPFWLYHRKILSLTLTEAELWLLPVFCAHSKGATTTYINARISTNSFPRYLRFRFFYARLFSQIQKVFSQSTGDKMRLEALGAQNIEVFGNLKLAEIPHVSVHYVPPAQPLWVIASTHKKNNQSEEELILKEILKAFDTNHTDTIPRFLFAPRHPERFIEVQTTLDSLLQAHKLPKLTKTSISGIQNALQEPFILLDSLGELNNLYSIANTVILGGSFLSNIGGHNPIEPAFFHAKLISGPFIFNQEALFSCVENYILCPIEELSQVLSAERLKEIKPAKLTKKLDITALIQSIQGHS